MIQGMLYDSGRCMVLDAVLLTLGSVVHDAQPKRSVAILLETRSRGLDPFLYHVCMSLPLPWLPSSGVLSGDLGGSGIALCACRFCQHRVRESLKGD